MKELEMKRIKKNGGPKKKQRSAKPKQQDAPTIQTSPLAATELDELEPKVRAAFDFLKKLDARDAGRDGHDEAATASQAVPMAKQAAAMQDPEATQIISTLYRLHQITVNGFLDAFESGIGRQSEEVLSTFIRTQVLAIRKLRGFIEDEGILPRIKAIAKRSLEFPAILSIFNSENKKFKTLVFDKAGLATGLGIKITKNRSLTHINSWALLILWWINNERNRKESIYRLVMPELDKKAIGTANDSWNTIIAFHLDYFQSPEQRWKEAASKSNLELWQRDREKELEYVTQKGGPAGDITLHPNFNSILAEGRNKNIKSRLDLYHYVKNKVLEAARGMMR